jgi:cytochrome c biogenesis protein CcmG, thiol:disulfide interchange protein DsbE
VALVAATAVGGAGLLSLLLTSGHKGESVANVGAQAPAIDLPDVRAGRARVVLAELRGTPVLVNFWATWCTPCRQEMPLLGAAHKRLGGKLAIVGVDVKDNRAEAVRFLADRKIDYPSAYDPDASLRRSFEFVGLPVTVLVGRDGRVLDRVTGAVTRSRLNQLLERGQATG